MAFARYRRALSVLSLSALLSVCLTGFGLPARAAAEPLKLDATQTRVLQLVRDDQVDEARALVKKSLEGKSDPELNYLLSVLDWKSQDYKEAAANLEVALAGRDASDIRGRALILNRIGDCYYETRTLKKALEYYQKAIAEAGKLPESDNLSVAFYEDAVGTLMLLKDIEQAETCARKMVEIASRGKSNRVADEGARLWANLQLGTIYRRQGKEKELKEHRKSNMALLDSLLTLRSELEEAGQLPDEKTFERYFFDQYLARNNPCTVAEYLWLAAEFRPLSLPLIEWRSQLGAPKAVLLCIHGLGLDNNAFSSFGKALAKRQFSVYALDVRGFGSWLSIPGQEDVGFKTALADIVSVTSMMQERHPGVPIFLLGESMGGGIALRACARSPEGISGVIASVPSAERFQGRRMGLSVAVHFLNGPSKPFNIGETVAEKATVSEDYRKDWAASFKSKMKMSPKELIKFAVFMRTTERQCSKIDKMPALIVQGLKDRLVKPEGTYKMFDAISSEDKTMLIDGTSEHLIFESDQQSQILLDTLTSWLDNHIAK